MSMAPFDHIAHEYDRQFTSTATGRLQRAVVHSYLEAKIRPGYSVLELNCGTGEDAVWLAKRGCRVLATDVSAEMVALTAVKARQAGCSSQVQTQVLDLRQLHRADGPGEPFDLVLSNFGGLNCLSPEEIQAVSAAMPALLRPGGMFVAVVMGRFCWWETLYFALKGQWRAATRRWGGGPVLAALNAGTGIPVWYYTPAAFRAFFSGLSVRTVQPVGFGVPPSYLDAWLSRRPRWLPVLDFIEKKCRGRLWAAAADHFLIAFQK
ncbi:MAG: class I SAM-dependent methyltransferase [Saprospirales bacterium]|nr:class I SAM-dependent methyltransferase [Saprospirales bacterium]